MDGIVSNAIVLNAADINENDKIIGLFSPERGKFSAVLKGVKKANAKMKFAAMPFCFAEFVLSERNGRYTVTNCTEIESFYELRLDLDRFYAGTCVLETLRVLGQTNQPDASLFLEAIRALKQLKTAAVPKTVLLHFLSRSLDLAGFRLQWKECTACGSKTLLSGIDFERGGIVCAQCADATVKPLPAGVIQTMKWISETDYDRLHTLKIRENILSGALKVLSDYFAYHVQRLKSAEEYLNCKLN